MNRTNHGIETDENCYICCDKYPCSQDFIRPTSVKDLDIYDHGAVYSMGLAHCSWPLRGHQLVCW